MDATYIFQATESFHQTHTRRRALRSLMFIWSTQRTPTVVFDKTVVGESNEHIVHAFAFDIYSVRVQCVRFFVILSQQQFFSARLVLWDFHLSKCRMTLIIRTQDWARASNGSRVRASWDTESGKNRFPSGFCTPKKHTHRQRILAIMWRNVISYRCFLHVPKILIFLSFVVPFLSWCVCVCYTLLTISPYELSRDDGCLINRLCSFEASESKKNGQKTHRLHLKKKTKKKKKAHVMAQQWKRKKMETEHWRNIDNMHRSWL